MKDTIKKEQFYPHPIATVWQAISNVEDISAWFIKADFEARVGYQYTFTHNNTVVKGEVLRADPVHTLIYTWIVGDPNTKTVVKWSLEEKDGGTQLTLEHSGISGYPTEEMATSMFSNFNGGWDNCLGQLTEHLVKEHHAERS